MKISNREELAKELDSFHACVRGSGEKFNRQKMILDALFPKPESRRLKHLRHIKTLIQNENRQNTFFVDGEDDALMVELLDAAIKAEEEMF